MDYDKILLEMLSRIQTLEEQVSELRKKIETEAEPEEGRVTTARIRSFICAQKGEAADRGEQTLTLRASHLHRALGLRNRYPMVCNAMRQSMEEGDRVVHDTPSGHSSSLEIEYQIGNKQS